MTTIIPDSALIVPTLNGGALWREWVQRFLGQSARPEHLLVVDSSSDDDTPEVAQNAGFEVLSIPRELFDHGGTRQMAFETVPASKFVVFMTQDALLEAPDSLGRLIATFNDDRVGAVYGRQLPNLHANPLEAHARLFNYSAVSHRRTLADVPQYGFKSAFMSDSFCAYRSAALTAVGGFPQRVLFGEDMLVAVRMLAAGWQLAYCADATVHHSHGYSFLQLLRRYFDIGTVHTREGWITEIVGHPRGEGLRFVASEIDYLLRENPWQIPRSFAHCFAKLVGYELGRRERRLPGWAKERLSVSPRFWRNQRA